MRLAAAAEKLEPGLDQMAFVGGSVTGLLLTDPAAAAVRPTLDVVIPAAYFLLPSGKRFTRAAKTISAGAAIWKI